MPLLIFSVSLCSLLTIADPIALVMRISTVTLLFFTIVISWILNSFNLEIFKTRYPKHALIASFYLIWTTYSTIQAADLPKSCLLLVNIWIVLFFFHFLFPQLITYPKILQKWLNIIVLLGVFLLTSSIVYLSLNISSIQQIIFRLRGVFLIHPNQFGSVLFLTILTLFHLLWYKRSKGKTVYLEIFLLWFLLTGLFLTLSRAAIIACFLALSIYITFYARRAFWFTVKLTFLALLPLVTVFIWKIYQMGLDYQSILFMGRVYSGLGRIKLWQTTIEIIKDNPVFGVGLGNIAEVMETYFPYSLKQWLAGLSPHNTYLRITAEVGVPSLIFYLLYNFCYFYLVASLIKNKKEPCGLRVLSLSVTCGFLFIQLFETQNLGEVIYSSFFYLLFMHLGLLILEEKKLLKT